jgi:hypothetical protein
MNAESPQRRAPRQAPLTVAAAALVIRLPPEGLPLLYVDCLNEGEEHRLAFWLNRARPEHAELWRRADELARKARAA